MNDIGSLRVLLDSPGCLLKELGAGKEIFLHHFPDVCEKSGFVELDALDESIRKNGRANLLCHVGEVWTMLRLADFRRRYKCISLAFDCQSSEFFFWMCETGQSDAFWISARKAWQKNYKLTLVPIGIFPNQSP